VEISNPDYVPMAFDKFKHPQLYLPQHAPHAWTIPVYGKQTQYATTDESAFLDEFATKQVQAISGTSFIMHMLLTPPSCQNLMKFPTNTPNQPRKLKKHADNYARFSQTSQCCYTA